MNILKKLREESSLTQQELAKKIGVHYRTIQNWENGEVQIKSDKAEQLADYFGVSAAYLLGYSGDKKNEISDIEFNRLIWRYFDSFRGKEFDKGFLSKERSIVNDLNKIIEINEDTELSDDKKEEKISNLVNNLIRQFSLYSVFVREKIFELKNKND
ncbi:Repressor LexA [Streptococcus parauberis]|uniref:Transcriptional regulator, Cro/CI family n=1 Tax=Streptococcus parauberis KRS-02083 TaxID=1207545 RepID=A0ABN0IUY6_9STRE|nr:helix-turn-helix domain-containing protein [Streptococcus parauberis]QBX09880.1 XRE family transcriptional regulator [Streptococcus satellite phage Javan396]AUT05444.1 Repressor LexA [Streptococcus parauberis]EMG26536.1 transcriptional regulator, Cro/CI family [Streptococcus parauberis KRS-02083]UWV10890.1 helix-turn-helix domain-containing protein [Streptococcus parauberis]WEM60901.1 helix-turn-helix domain-containing protein [Streptococcus parauberis]